MKSFLLKCLPVLLTALCLNASAQDNRHISGDYKGYIELPGLQLKVVVHLREDDRKLSGSVDIPEQNAKDLPLDKIKLSGDQLTYSIPAVPGNASFSGTWKPEKDSINGLFSQNGASFRMFTGKAAAIKERPQLSQFARMQKIEAYIDTVIRRGKMAGCAVAVIKDGEILMNRGFGYRDYDKKIKCDQNTLFAIGSCTKAFTAALLASLKDEGLFEWDKPVKQYMPWFAMKDKFADEQINATDLCSHRSGLPRHDLVWYGSSLSRRELVERIRYLEPCKPFRTTWQYNNFMFLTAGVLAEEIAHDTWENLVQKRLFDAIGMKSSKIHFSDFTAAENKALGYEETDRKIVKTEYRNIDMMGPAGSIFSTSTDMIEWVRLLLNKGQAGNRQVLSEEQVKFLLTPIMMMPAAAAGSDFKQAGYAPGWIVSQYKGKTLVEHGGNIDGFSADVMMFPEEKLGIVVLSNKDGSGIPTTLGMYIADRLLDHDEYDWYEEKIGKTRRIQDAEQKQKPEETKKTAKTSDSKKTAPKKGPLHENKAYAGEYADAAYGKLQLVQSGTQLKALYNSLELEVKHQAFETFVATYREQELKMTFFTNDLGKVEWVQIQMDPAASPVAFKKQPVNYLKNEAYLNSILGNYEISGISMVLSLKDGKLHLDMSDGQAYELVPSGENLFALKGAQGFNMEMVFDEKGRCIKMISHQPNGDFEALRK